MRRAVTMLSTVLLLLPVVAAAQSKLPLGLGAGTFTPAAGAADVESWTFEHAIAYRAFENDDRSKRITVVLLSTVPIDEARAQDEAHLVAEAKAGRLRALQIRLRNADGAVLQHAVFDGRGRTAVDAPDKAKFTKTSFFTTRVEGQVYHYPSIDTSATVQRGYLVMFNARVRQGPWRQPGEATGTLTIGTRAFTVTHAAMVEEEKQTTVVLSGQAIDDVSDREAVAARAAAQGFAVLWATVANDGKVTASRCAGPGAAAGGVEAAGLDWDREDWRNGLMRGTLRSEDAPSGSACVADVYFAAGR